MRHKAVHSQVNHQLHLDNNIDVLHDRNLQPQQQKNNLNQSTLVLEWPRWSLDLNTIENLNIDTHRHSLFNCTELERFCKAKQYSAC